MGVADLLPFLVVVVVVSSSPENKYLPAAISINSILPSGRGWPLLLCMGSEGGRKVNPDRTGP
jgi:hypothetical protein